MMQLELFNASEFVHVTKAVRHLSDRITKFIDGSKSMHRVIVMHPDALFNTAPFHGDSAKLNFNGCEASVSPKKINVFRKTPKCVCCGREANVAVVEAHVGLNGPSEHRAAALYHIDENGVGVMMTVDHILLDSIGGRFAESNLQAMCQACNAQKGNTMSLAEIAMVRQNPKKYAKEWVDIPYLLEVLGKMEAWVIAKEAIVTKADKKAVAQLRTEYEKAASFCKHGKRPPVVKAKPVAIEVPKCLSWYEELVAKVYGFFGQYHWVVPAFG